MELASPREPWTAAVAWARPWHRPPRRPIAPMPAAAAGDATTVASRVLHAVTDTEWRVALLHLDAVRAQRAALDVSGDTWAAVVADHAIHLALMRVRCLAADLGLYGGHVPDR